MRQIQHLLVLCSLLRRDSPLARILTTALELDPVPMAARATPAPSVHPQETKDWLESFWDPAALTPDEVEVAAWQNNITEMVTAVEEIHAIEKLIDIRLTSEKAEQPKIAE
ncbi:hypothetical protein DZF91_12050 [Actinomadura logoneensis]|uniref:Uncharacterized protein n=1 Tax=Actinomadura logoneensis TaxID=2293572 RepID=A0A372JNN6_9ACTN|nr:hypothetical protein DZF91_12050 [Actinomadura logoneensis]